MSADGLGRVFNTIYSASGVSVPLTKGTAVTFLSFLDAGTQALTFTQTIAGASSTSLTLFTFGGTAPTNGTQSKIYAGPNAGGGWALKAPTAAAVYTNADATNDVVAITVRAEQLADGYDSVVCTAATGTCVAIVHDLLVARKPSNLQSSLVV
jgi:hypothetical protein